MDNFNEILQAATAAIETEYFLLPVHGAPSVYRERVYCYELYHQMRSRWPHGESFSLNGEVDKRAHPDFPGASYPKPDLLVHVPGDPRNFAAIEVKSVRGSNAGLRKDLKTLERFRQVGYQRAIFLMYGATLQQLRDRIQSCGAAPELLTGIEFWAHEQVHASAVRIEGLPA